MPDKEHRVYSVGGEIKKRKNRMKKEEITWLFFFFVCLFNLWFQVCVYFCSGWFQNDCHGMQSLI